MFSRINRRRSNLQDLGRLSKSCPAVDSPVYDDGDSDDSDASSSPSDPFAEESGEEMSPPVSRAEKQFARQSLRRAKQREGEHKRNMEENKISMDDYLGKQTVFRQWLLEEQKKQDKELSSPKRKTYFKMFVRLWNKRHLPAKFYESRTSTHLNEDDCLHAAATTEVTPLDPGRPKFSLMQNSPMLDPSIFPHTIDLSSDSIALGTPTTPFSTFGKAKPSAAFSTPLRISANSKEDVLREKDIFKFGENKENATQSLPVTATSQEVFRTATISPRKKMMSACTDRSMDRTSVQWSPRGQPKLNAVGAPRCPSPFAQEILACEAQERAAGKATDDATGMIGKFAFRRQASTLPRTASVQPYQLVHDYVALESPDYAEISFGESGQHIFFGGEEGGDVMGDGESVRSFTRQPKGYRRRSRSLDEAPVYAVPSRQAQERHWSRKQAPLRERSPASPPPLPPKRFDPHVEGLGVPFSPPVFSQREQADQPNSGNDTHLEPADEAVKKLSKKPFKGKLPWFGKKLTSSSRRRSRSCEVLSPPAPSAEVGGRRGGQFPLMELERSPPSFSRRVLTRPLKPPGQQAGVAQKAERVQSPGFELTEYTASPARFGRGGASVQHPEPLGSFKRVKSIRRRSKSVEPMGSPFLAASGRCKNAGVAGKAMSPPVLLESTGGSDSMSLSPLLKQFQTSSQLSPGSAMEADRSLNQPLEHAPAAPLPSDLSTGGARQAPQQCDIYEEIKSDVKRDLSSLVSKIQSRSALKSVSPQHPSAAVKVDSPVQVQELRSSPKRLGCSRDLQETSRVMSAQPDFSELLLSSEGQVSAKEMETNDHVEISKSQVQCTERKVVAEVAPEMSESPYRSSLRAAARKYLPGSQETAGPQELAKTSAYPQDLHMTPAYPQDLHLTLACPQDLDLPPPPVLTPAYPQDLHLTLACPQDLDLPPPPVQRTDVDDSPDTVTTMKEQPRDDLDAVDKTTDAAQPSLSIATPGEVALSEKRTQQPSETPKQRGAGRETGQGEESTSVVLVPEKETNHSRADIIPGPVSDKETDRTEEEDDTESKALLGAGGQQKAKAEMASVSEAVKDPPTCEVLAFSQPAAEVACLKEAVKAPLTLEDVAFSQPAASAQLVSGVCQPLSSAGPNIPAWLTRHRALQPQRRRSRSLGDSAFPLQSSGDIPVKPNSPVNPDSPMSLNLATDTPMKPNSSGSRDIPMNLNSSRDAPMNLDSRDFDYSKDTSNASNSFQDSLAPDLDVALKPGGGASGEATAITTLSMTPAMPVLTPVRAACLSASGQSPVITTLGKTPAMPVLTPVRGSCFSASGEATVMTTLSLTPEIPVLTPIMAAGLSTLKHSTVQRRLLPLIPAKRPQTAAGCGLTSEGYEERAELPQTTSGHHQAQDGQKQQLPETGPTQRSRAEDGQPGTAPTRKVPPPVQVKPAPLKQARSVFPEETPPPVRSQVSVTPQAAEEAGEAESPTVKSILQRFGGSFRRNNRRRSRSVGDMSPAPRCNPAADGEGSGGLEEEEEEGGFANVRAFWDRLKGRGGGKERGGVTLQRKPSIMKQLQQQLERDPVAPPPRNSPAARTQVLDRPNPFKHNSSKETAMSLSASMPSAADTHILNRPNLFKQNSSEETSLSASILPAASVVDLPKPLELNSSEKAATSASMPPAVACEVADRPNTFKDSFPEDGKNLSQPCVTKERDSQEVSLQLINSAAQKNLEGNEAEDLDKSMDPAITSQKAAVNKFQDADSEAPLWTSPFVTVRRQSSRKQNAGSPYAASDQNRSRTDSPLSRGTQDGKEASFTSVQSPVAAANNSSSPVTARAEAVTPVVVAEGTPLSAGLVKATFTMIKADTERETGESTSTSKGEITDDVPKKKKGKAPPPKPLPKPKVRLESLRRPAEFLTHSLPASPQVGCLGYPSKTRKRRSQENEFTGVPQKVSAVSVVGGASQQRGSLTRSTSRLQPGVQENNTTLAENSSLTQQEKTGAGATKDSRPAKRRSNDAVDGDGSLPVKRTNSAKIDEGVSTPPRRQSSGREARTSSTNTKKLPNETERRHGEASPSVTGTSSGRQHGSPLVKRQSSGKATRPSAFSAKRTSSGRESKGSSPAVRRISSGKDSRASSPAVRRISSGKDSRAPSPAVRRVSSGKDSRASSPAVRRVSSGKDQAGRGGSGTPKRRSSGRVTVTKINIARRQGGGAGQHSKIWTPSGQKSSHTVVERTDSFEAEKQTDMTTPSSLTPNNDLQNPFSPAAQSAVSGAARQDDSRGAVAAAPVKRMHSSRAESKPEGGTASLVKRFNSLRDDTRRSAARRRSGHGVATPEAKRTSVGKSVRATAGATPGAKRTSSGRATARRESGRVRRTNSKRGREEGNTTPKRTESFKKAGAGRTPQSPTFLRIRQGLGLPNEESSDEEEDCLPEADAQVRQEKTAFRHKLEAQLHAKTSEANLRQDDRRQGKEVMRLHKVPARVRAKTSPQRSADGQMETDV